MHSLIPYLTTSLSLFHLALSSPNPSPDYCARATPPHPFHKDLTICLDSHITGDPRAWHPWTHKPYCIGAAEEPWCVFTSAASPRPHGLSVITTPDQAAAALSPLAHALDAPFFAPHRLCHGASSSSSSPSSSSRPYEVRDVPGKGKGAIATRRIERGCALLVDPATVLAAVEYPADVLRSEVQELLGRAAEQLSEPESVLGLARKGAREDGDEVTEVEDVMLTNTFGVTIGGREYMALFSNLARFNHACRPNAFIHFSETTLAMTVWAARDIEPGEEITITYSTAGMTFQERQETLEKVWGFKCQCDLCASSPEALNASDTRRTRIRALQEEVITLAQKGEFHRAVESAELLFDLVEEEGLAEQMGYMYEVPARLYYHVGNLEKALEYTLKVRHEIDGYGVPGKLGSEKIKMLEKVIERIERELEEKKRQREADAREDDEK